MSSIPKINLHTHTLFCDGKASAEDNVIKAIEKNFDILGFSAHSLYPFSSDWHMSVRDFKNYTEEIKRLKNLYADKIKILTGFEADYLPPFSYPDFDNYKDFDADYLIASVHYLYNEKGQFTVDNTPDLLLKGIKDCFNNNVKEYVHSYFEQQRNMLKTCKFTILGHCDLIRKFNTTLKLFTENEMWYKQELLLTAIEIAKAGVIAEVNTGAIARGYMTSPYPSQDFLCLLKEHNVPVMINSDSHTSDALDCAYDIALMQIKKAGYKELAVPQAGKIDFYKI